MKAYCIIIGIAIFIFLALLDKEYMKKFSIYKFVFIIYIATVFVLFYILCGLINELIQINFYDKIVIFLACMSLSFIIDAIFIKVYQVLNQKIKIIKSEKKLDIKKKDYLYYREILKEYSPGILAFCYNKKIKTEDIIVSTILDLEKQQKIKIINNKISIDNNIGKLEIKEYEKIILSYCMDKESISKKVFKRKLYKSLEDETSRCGLIKRNDVTKDNYTYIMELFMVWLIIYILVNIASLIAMSTLGIWMFVSYFLTFACIPTYKKLQKNIKIILRTKKGIDIAAKVNGLRKYIIDYSNIKDKGIENIEIFEEYVIYAIMFNLSGKLNNEAKNLYKDLIK